MQAYFGERGRERAPSWIQTRKRLASKGVEVRHPLFSPPPHPLFPSQYGGEFGEFTIASSNTKTPALQANIGNKISISFPIFTLGNFYGGWGWGIKGSNSNTEFKISGEGREARGQNKILRGFLPAPLSKLSQTRITERFSRLL